MENSLKPRFIVRLKLKLLWAYSNITSSFGPVAVKARKKTTLISMIRNEKGILEAFCAHALSLFDRVILIDHLSSDGTREYIKLLSGKYPSVEYYFFDEPGYYQSELMTWAAKNLVDKKTPGWLFFLDADEFLPFRSKEEFDRKLLEFGTFPVISMPWLNLIPLDMESNKVINGFFLTPPKPSRHHKIAFQPSRIAADNYFVAQGNHSLFMESKSAKVKFPAKNSFPIYHLPIRTKQQLREKIFYGVESYQRMGSNRRGKTGSHWDEIHQIMQTTNLTDELMAGIAAQYSDTLRPPYERSLDELRKNGYKELRMDICSLKLLTSYADVTKRQAEETLVNDNYASAVSRAKSFRKINFNVSTREMQITE